MVALQTVVSRNVDPREMAVISVGAIQGGEAANVIPQNVTMRLTVRASGGCMVHNPGYDFNDAILPIAASYWVQLVNAFLKAA